MIETIVAAIIKAASNVLVAVIGLYGRKSTKQNPAPQDQGKVDLPALEQALRNDARVQRLLGNPNWQPAAEAAIAFACRGTSCDVRDWKKSRTWQQIMIVHRELTQQTAA